MIELVTVVTIVGILAAIAYPNYEESVRKSRRADAKGALLGLANAMERHFTENNTYLGAAGGGNTGPPAIFPTQAPLDGTTKHYNLSITAATQTTYTLAAAPISGGPQANDKCGTLTVSQTGAKGAATTDCW